MSTRWDPVRDMLTLREAMNNLFEEGFMRPRLGSSSLPVDVKETAEEYVILASLPGAKIDEVDISVLGNSLRISGELTERDDETGDARWLIRERRAGEFERSVTLPTPVNPERASASLEDGILTVRLPKADSARPKAIPVKGRTQP